MRLAVSLVCLAACGPSPRDRSVDAPTTTDAPAAQVDATACPPPATAAGVDVQLAPPFDTLYAVYDLGPVPGVPNALGGTVVRPADHDKLLVAGASESAGGAIYEIGITRNVCGHITGFAGMATQVASTPYVDANLVYLDPSLLAYTEWPQFTFSQLAAASSAPDRRTDLRMLGMPDTSDSGPGGLGIVPPGLAAAGELRLVTWPGGRWFHAASAPDAGLVAITSIAETATLPNEPGGFAYVPAGSPGFTAQSLIVAEWRSDSTQDRVAVYDVDAQGDPLPASRKEFFQKFPRPWGAYFEPVTGDYLFLSWGTGEDHVYIVEGFVPPPPIF